MKFSYPGKIIRKRNISAIFTIFLIFILYMYIACRCRKLEIKKPMYNYSNECYEKNYFYD
ncbi:hypothetical protein MXB_4390, partial [Myxobolus squamalis]